jgi:hypothetical protein
MRKLLGVVCVLVAASATADTLFEVKAAVNRLTAKTPVRATFTSQQNVKTAGKWSNNTMVRSLSVEAAHDANGITFTIPQTLLDQATHEVATRAAETPAQTAIRGMNPSNVVEALDFRNELLRLLDGATVAAEKRAVFRGKATRLLTLKLAPPKKEKDTITIGEGKSERTLNLWIGDDNVPLAGDQSDKTTAGFLMFHATTESKTSYSFAHVADRLVLARLETNSSGAGMGQKFDEATVQTLTLH